MRDDQAEDRAEPPRPSAAKRPAVASLPQPGQTAARGALVGAVLGVDAIGHCIALATLCFAGGLASGLAGGLGLATAVFLASTVVMGLTLVFRSAFANAIGIAQDTSIAILAPAVAMAAAAAAGGDEATRIATALAVIGAAALLSGLAFVTVGRLGLGSVVRLVPYPVAAGFLASSGLLLVLAAVQILTDAGALTDVPARLTEPDVWSALLPALALAAALLLAIRHRSGAFGFVGVILAAIVAFYAVLLATGIGVEGARAHGLLPPASADGLGGPGALVALYGQVDWAAVAQTVPVLVAVVLINLIGILLNISGVELATRRDVDVNRELRLTGWANLAIGGFGGLTSFMTSGSTIVANKFAPGGRAAGLGFSAVILLGLLLAGPIVASVPVFVAAGLLLFIGASMLGDWLVATRQRLVAADWLIILGIVLVTLVFGILTAIVVGLCLAVLAFVIGYARLPVIRQSTDSRSRRSTLQRPPEEDAVLANHGARIRLLHLQGYLFFGSLDRMIRNLGAEMDAARQGHAAEGMLILDLGAVTGLDSAGCSALGKLGFQAQARGVRVHLAAMPADVRRTVDRWGLELSDASGLQCWPSVDAALEACETAMITAELGPAHQVSVSGRLHLLGHSHPRIADLMGLMHRIDLDQGATLIRRGTRSGDVYFLDSGRLAVLIPSNLGGQTRISSLAPGAVVGEVARYRDSLRTADVAAEKPSVVYCLSETVLDRLEQDDRDLAALVHAILATALAEKVARTSRLVTLS